MADFTFTITVPDNKAAEILEAVTDNLDYETYVEDNGPISRQDYLKFQARLWLRGLYRQGTQKKLAEAAKVTQSTDADLVAFD